MRVIIQLKHITCLSAVRKTLILLCFKKYRYLTSSFERPQVQKLVELVRANQIDCIIVKDYCAIIGLNQKDLENQGILA